MKIGMVLAIGLLFLTTANPAIAGKQKCKKHLEKLHNIQSLQRQGGSLKKTQSLRKREEKARNKWWQCEKGK